MNFICKPPSLQHLALVKITATLFNNQHDVWTQLAKYQRTQQKRVPFRNPRKHRLLAYKKWEKILDKVGKKVWALEIPEECKQRIQHFLEPIGQEMYAWFQHHYEGKDDDLFQNHFPIQLCWSARGTIDSRRTAALLVKNESLSVKKRYQLACMNCLEKEILKLFRNIPEDHKKKIIKAKKQYVWSLPFFWTWVLSDEDQLEKKLYTRLSCSSSCYYNFTAGKSKGPLQTSEYFFEKLSLRRKHEVLVTKPPKFPHNHLNIPVIVSYLSQISLEHQQRYFAFAAGDVLVLFSNWPWQAFFMEAAKHLWPFVNQRFYDNVLCEVGSKISRRSSDYDYFKLFREFCSLSHSRFKEFLHLSHYLMKEVFFSKNEELVQFILKETNEDQKRRFEPHVQRFRRYGFRHYDHILILQFLMDESIVSDETLIKCRRNFKFDYLSELDECETLNVVRKTVEVCGS